MGQTILNCTCVAIITVVGCYVLWLLCAPLRRRISHRVGQVEQFLADNGYPPRK